MTTDLVTGYIDVRLTWQEVAIAAHSGMARHIRNRMKGTTHRYNLKNDDGWQKDILGACGECAVAKATGRYWADMGTGFDPTNDDVQGAQVRHTPLHHGRLLLHPTDADDKPFVLVTGLDPCFRVHGWILARDGKRDEWWEDPTKEERWAFFVPQRVLRPMRELP